ncbi:MAG: hypothetical protein QM784_35575 [Polyangiaceae bacterium]
MPLAKERTPGHGPDDDMDASGSHEANKTYYNAFSANYERHRGINDPGGYHELLDELEADYVSRFGTGKSVLEVGCGTGLVLSRIQQFASAAKGVESFAGNARESARARSRCRGGLGNVASLCR